MHCHRPTEAGLNSGLFAEESRSIRSIAPARRPEPHPQRPSDMPWDRPRGDRRRARTLVSSRGTWECRLLAAVMTYPIPQAMRVLCARYQPDETFAALTVFGRKTSTRISRPKKAAPPLRRPQNTSPRHRWKTKRVFGAILGRAGPCDRRRSIGRTRTPPPGFPELMREAMAEINPHRRGMVQSTAGRSNQTADMEIDSEGRAIRSSAACRSSSIRAALLPAPAKPGARPRSAERTASQRQTSHRPNDAAEVKNIAPQRARPRAGFGA